MLSNYLKIAFRSLQKNSVYSFINIAGLSVGIACSMLIMLWVNDELSFNKFIPNHDRLHQVWLNANMDNGIQSGNSMPMPLMDALTTADSRIKNVCMTNWGEGALMEVGDKKLNKVGRHASEQFLEMFQFPMLAGDRATALQDPYSIVLTKSVAKALFGDEDPMGKFIRIEDQNDLKVTGILADIPKNSSIQLDFVIPFSYYEATQEWVKSSKTNWENFVCQVFVELQPAANQADVENSIRDLIKGKVQDEQPPELFLHPMDKWYLYSRFSNGKIDGGLIEYVKMFSVIALFILVIACINFMNLATARSEHRAREVGIRKSVGSRRKELIFQFLGESLLIAFVSFIIALMLVEIALPFYNTLVDKNLSIQYTNPVFIGIALLLIVITGILAGSYPAFYLSAFRPAQVLKGKIKAGKGASLPRKVLVILQFGFSILLVIGTVVIFQQIDHLRKREVGYDRENLMMIWTTRDIEKNYDALKQELTQAAAVVSVCKSNSPVTAIFSMNTVDEWPGKLPDQRVQFTTIATDYDYTKTMGIKMLMGRDFSPDFNDSSSVVINRAAMEVMGLEDPIGAKIKIWGMRTMEIIGVMENVVMVSPHEPVRPLFMIYDPEWSSTINVRLARTDDIQASIAQVETLFRKHNPAYPFEYRFADWEFEKKFTSLNRIRTLAYVFASLAIFITCLGLFGLAAFTAEQRTKEIGIRKVMGASVTNVVLLISRDFTRLVLFAFVVSAPLAWWAMEIYLERFQYRIAIAWWIFPATGLLALGLALFIVSSQAIRASMTNPVESLRTE